MAAAAETTDVDFIEFLLPESPAPKAITAGSFAILGKGEHPESRSFREFLLKVCRVPSAAVTTGESGVFRGQDQPYGDPVFKCCFMGAATRQSGSVRRALLGDLTTEQRRPATSSEGEATAVCRGFGWLRGHSP